MKFEHALYCLILALAPSACTPIAPSIHKSVLRSGDSQRVLPNPSPSSQQPHSPQKLTSDQREAQLEVRWVRSDEQLSEELDSDKVKELRRLSSEELSRLRKEGLIKFTPVEESSEDSHSASLAPLRLVLRVQMSEERLQDRVSGEAWQFWWEDEYRKHLGISHSDPKGQIAEALVSVHLVSDKKKTAKE